MSWDKYVKGRVDDPLPFFDDEYLSMTRKQQEWEDKVKYPFRTAEGWGLEEIRLSITVRGETLATKTTVGMHQGPEAYAEAIMGAAELLADTVERKLNDKKANPYNLPRSPGKS